MVHRVVQWGTGRVGSDAIVGIAGHPDLELVGVWVHSEEKEGRDAGEICGIDPLGVHATRDKDALLALPADCVCYATARTWGRDPSGIVDEICRILRSGRNVVNVAWPALVAPQGIGGGVYERLQAACLEGGVSFYTGGVDPGYGSLGLAVSALGVTSEIRSVRMYEILNYAHWDNREWIREVMGFGQREVGSLFTPGRLAGIFGPMLSLLAEKLGTRIEEIVEAHDAIYADEAFEVAAAHIAPGTISGLRFEIRGMIGGEPRIVVEHVTKLRDQDFAELGFEGGGYRVEVDGEPCVRLDMKLSLKNVEEGSLIAGASGRPALFATAMTVVNAIPQVCEAPPGVLTYLDLKPHPSRNLGASGARP
ncbi:MAG: dihydrodipicolinate reductase [Spirochaetaceae bacterium]|nr:dihydrodipicolinate reductase [Spirochaetaceae bacterium]HPG24911.1 dihydrodipicolinate reductase [Myxococcota bacterium]